MVLEGLGYFLCCSSPLQKSLMDSDTVGFFEKTSHVMLVGSFLECSGWILSYTLQVSDSISICLCVCGELELCWVSIQYMRSRLAGKALSVAVLPSAGFPSAFSAAFLLIFSKQTRLNSQPHAMFLHAQTLPGATLQSSALWASCRYIQLPVHLLGKVWTRMFFLIHENLERSLPTTSVRTPKI